MDALFSEENFDQPFEFKPERFLKESKDSITSFSYIPFGGGPRKCIGMRFAMIEMKLAMAKLIRKFKIVEVPETKLDFFSGDYAFLSYSDLYIKLEDR